MIPTPTPEQAVHVLEILEQWTKRGWWYDVLPLQDYGNGQRVMVSYANPLKFDDEYGLDSTGVNHFDALCQATTVMQVLLEEHPEKQ